MPFVHMWSPSFVPKPPDWGPLVDVVGNFFSTKLEVRGEEATGNSRPKVEEEWLEKHD